MKWTDQAWNNIQPILSKIKAMPFIQELKAGTLELDKFQYYMQQDSKYLEHYGRVLSAIGAKSEGNQQALDFFEFGRNALVVESALHGSYFREFGIESTEKINEEPGCHHYVHFLKSTVAFDPLEVAIAAILPCFWIYKEVGDYIYRQFDKTNNPYHQWIDTYSGVEFAEAVKKAIFYVNSIAAETTDPIREKMMHAFITSSRLEYQFWKAAYEKTTWE